ncbi:unnamed protein product [Lathyrus oleraceus]
MKIVPTDLKQKEYHVEIAFQFLIATIQDTLLFVTSLLHSMFFYLLLTISLLTLTSLSFASSQSQLINQVRQLRDSIDSI